jgi:hypothetical protein
LHCRHIDRQCPTSSSDVCSFYPDPFLTSHNGVTAKRLKQKIVDICNVKTLLNDYLFLTCFVNILEKESFFPIGT